MADGLERVSCAEPLHLVAHLVGLSGAVGNICI